MGLESKNKCRETGWGEALSLLSVKWLGPDSGGKSGGDKWLEWGTFCR